MLPPELAAISTPEERAAEYLDYRQFFIAWETLERVTECQALEAPQMSRDTRAAWLKDYGVRALHFPFPAVMTGVSHMMETQGLVSSAREQILKLLIVDWLVPESDIPASTSPCSSIMSCHLTSWQWLVADRRGRELARIRHLFIPDLILRLHALLVSSRTHIPECVLFFQSYACPHAANHQIPFFLPIFFCLVTSGMPYFWRMSSLTRDICCSPSLRGRMGEG